jgi:hypothetical protein
MEGQVQGTRDPGPENMCTAEGRGPRAQRRAPRARPLLAAALAATLLAACVPAEGSEDERKPARSTMVVGIDVSGSFESAGRYESAIDFASHYIYAHLNGLGGLRVPTALFVGSVGGEIADEWKSFQPIHTFQGKSVEEIRAYLRKQYPANDGITDFNPFFERVATLVKRQGLVLAPLEVVVLSDGVPDERTGNRAPRARAPIGTNLDDKRWSKIDVAPLEYLSRSVTVRVLYPTPTVAVRWERDIERRRVRMWTVDDEVMKTWKGQLVSGGPEQQEKLWKWIADNVDFRVRSL